MHHQCVRIQFGEIGIAEHLDDRIEVGFNFMLAARGRPPDRR
jgi:hypothetical protein